MDTFEPDFNSLANLSKFFLRKGKTGPVLVGKSKPVSIRLDMVSFLRLKAIAEYTDSSIGEVACNVIESALPELVDVLGKGGFDADSLVKDEVRKLKEVKP